MNSIVNLKDGFITFNSNIDHSLSFSKCAIGYSNYGINSHERGALVFLTNNNANTTNYSMNSDIRMCIASDGNVGIGTTTNTEGVLLDVNGTIESRNSIGANNSFYLKGVANSDINRVITAGQFSTNSAVNDMVIRSTNKLVLQSGTTSPGIVIDTANNVGIGFNFPVNKLHISSGLTGSTGVNTIPIKISSGAYNDNGNNTSTLIGLSTEPGAGVKCAIGHCRTDGYDVGSIVFLCNNSLNFTNVSMSDEKMRIDAVGNVGIGITIPQTKLDINGNLLIRAYGTSGSGTRGIFFREGDFLTTNPYNCSILTFDHNGGGPTDGLSFNGYDGLSFCTGSNSRQERMRIDINGNVGIGVVPSYRCHIKCTYDSVASGLHLDASDAVASGPNQYALTIWPYVIGGGMVGWRFRTQSNTGGTNTPLTFDNTGNVILGGTISGNGSLLTSINAANITSGTLPVTRGGIGTTTLTATQLLVGNGTNPVTSFSGLTWTSGTNTLAATNITGAGSNITHINATNISSGTIDGSRLPVATSSVLGGVKVDGTTITINSSTGVISGANTYVLPAATSSVLGGVKKGNNINIDPDGVISLDLLSYNGNSTINGDLIVNSNLVVHGTSTTLNTDVYTTERLEVTNSGTINSTLTIKQTAAGNTNNIFNVINSATTNVFNVSSAGNVGIGTTTNTAGVLLDVNGIIESRTSIGANTSLYLKGVANSDINRVTTAGQYSTGSAVNDMVIRSTNKLVLQSGTAAPGIVIDTGNNVGIGITNPAAQNSLHIHKTAAAQFIKIALTDGTTTGGANRGLHIIKETDQHGYIYNYENKDLAFGTNATEKMRILANGNVGIGTNNPVNILHLHNTVANSDVAIRFTDSTSGAGAANGFAIGENSSQKAYLWNYGNTDMLFATNNVERMNISNTGNVGIGTNSALSSLHLHKNALAQDVRIILSDNTTTASVSRGLQLIKGTDNQGYLWNYENASLAFGTNNALRMYILNNGNVGIGTDTGITEKLVVSGNAQITGTISGNGSLLTNINAANITSGTIDSSRLPIATSSVLGGVKVDGTTITINSSTGVITSVGGGSSQWTTSGINIYNANAGNVGIGTTNPTTYKLNVNGTIGASGNITASYSDERLKNITEYVTDVLPVLDKINVFKYNCNDLASTFGYDKSKKEIGLSAQEIEKYYPEVVSIAPFDAKYDKETEQIISKSGENYLTLDYERLVPVLLQAIKELNHKYTALEDKYNKIMPM